MAHGSREAEPFHFIQLADPQFGMYAWLSGKSAEEVARYRARRMKVAQAPKIEGYETESRLFRQAVSEANRLRPDFVVTCGDIVHCWDKTELSDEALSIAGDLDDGISMYWVPGNHDLGVYSDGPGLRFGTDFVRPTTETLANYRQLFGPDYYSFSHKGVTFIVVNSAVMHTPDAVPGEWEAQLRFLERELAASSRRGVSRAIVLAHHPFFLRDPEEEVEEESHLVIPRERRRVVLDLFRRYGVRAVFAGHWHRNNYAWDGDMEMVASGSVGYPLGDDPSGYRVVRVYPDRIAHDYYGFGEGPVSVEL